LVDRYPENLEHHVADRDVGQDEQEFHYRSPVLVLLSRAVAKMTSGAAATSSVAYLRKRLASAAGQAERATPAELRGQFAKELVDHGGGAATIRTIPIIFANVADPVGRGCD
jgi:hypothetical protein